jgi:two-component system sensor histidine kinase RegB
MPLADLPPALPGPEARDRLVRLRWAALGGQLATVSFAAFALGFPVSWLPMAVVVGLTGLSNLALARSQDPRALPAALLFDLAALTALLANTGGASNPFSVLYLVHVALAAVMLGSGWAWRVALVAVAGFALLFPFTDPHAMHRGTIEAHLAGMWAAFGVTAAGIAWFVARLAAAVRERDAQIAALRQRQERHERVLGLATLAAGAAHELGSPLSAIAVGAREIALLAGERQPEIAEEAAALRIAVDRCRQIVGRLTHRAGVPRGDSLSPLPLSALEAGLRARWSPAEAARIALALPGDWTVRAPLDPLVEAVGALVDNALRAGPGAVRLSAEVTETGLLLQVEDQGVGLDPALLSRIGEPFFTTRPPGEGTGLGVFLASRLAETLGGALLIRSTLGVGTTALLTLPGARP